MAHWGGGWFAYLRYDEEQDRPTITRDLLARVWEFARPYRWQVAGLLLTILLISGISLISPLLFRALIDDAIPNGNVRLLNLLALGLVAIPLVNGVIGVWQRNLNSQVGEGSSTICGARSTAIYSACRCVSSRRHARAN